MKTRVDFVFFERANYPTVAPVVDRLLSHRNLEPLVIRGWDYKEASGEVAPLVLPDRVPQLDIFSLAPPKSTVELKPEFLRTRDRDDPIAALAVESLQEQEFWSPALDAYRRAREGLQTFVERYRPTLAVVSDDVHYAQGRLAAKILRRHGVQVVALVAPYYQWIDSTPSVGERVADSYFVMNAHAAASLREQGVSDERIVRVGCPYFSERNVPDHDASVPITRVLYPLQGSLWEEVIVSDLRKAIERHPRCDLVVKTHPAVRSEPTFLERFAGDSRVTVARHGPIGDWLKEGTCLVTETSSCAVEAGYRRIPVLLVDYTGLPARIRTSDDVLRRRLARDPSELIRLVDATLEGALAPEPPEAWLDDNAHCVDLIVEFLDAAHDSRRGVLR